MLKKAKEALAHRQKLIHLADRSELVWAVVEEYEADELADDSDDEKKIYRAEMRAERKAKNRKSRRRRCSREG